MWYPPAWNGYMSDFTANRKAVMITDEGGVLVSTPRYGINENEQVRNIKGKLDNNGTLNMNVSTTYQGVQQDQLSQLINGFVFNYAYRDKDQIEIEIPTGYEIESAPKDISIQTKFGSYQFKSTYEGNKIMYSRTREQFSGRFPASKQKEIIQFYADVYKADRSRIVLVKSSND